MTQQNKLGLWKALAAAAVVAISLIPAAQGSDRQGSVTEEFHKVYPLSAQGRVSIKNINGAVHITAWDRDEVKIDAVKSAWSQQRLDEATIEVRAESNDISIHTEYADHGHNQTFNFGGDGERNNPASVEYTITVPRNARLDEVKLINGRLDLQDVAGEVHASSINGRVEARNLQGPVELETINGVLDASFDHLPSSAIKLSSVNGRVRVTLPSDAQAEIKASVVSGSISNDFGLSVTRHQYVGKSLHGQLGGGGTLVKLSNVNGAIEIHHASDNRPISSVRNLEHERSRGGDDKDDDDDEI